MPLVYLVVAIRVVAAGVPCLEIVRESRRMSTQKLRLRVAHSEKRLRADRKRCARALDPKSCAVHEPTFRLHSRPRSPFCARPPLPAFSATNAVPKGYRTMQQRRALPRIAVALDRPCARGALSCREW